MSILPNPNPKHDDVALSRSLVTASIQLACSEIKLSHGSTSLPQSVHLDNVLARLNQG